MLFNKSLFPRGLGVLNYFPYYLVKDNFTLKYLLSCFINTAVKKHITWLDAVISDFDSEIFN